MIAINYGHSCIALEFDNTKLLFDPFITLNPLAKHIDIGQIKPDYILLSHGHFDHVADLVSIQKNKDATVICIADMQAWLKPRGISKVHTMNIGGSYPFDFGRVKMVYALHSSSMPDGSYGGNPAGFVIYAAGKKIYFAGDTALTMDMKLLANENLDWAFLPIGDNFTMGVDDAIKAAEFLNCKNIAGIHYNTFPHICIDEKQARDKFKDAKLNFQLIPIEGILEL